MGGQSFVLQQAHINMTTMGPMARVNATTKVSDLELHWMKNKTSFLPNTCPEILGTLSKIDITCIY